FWIKPGTVGSFDRILLRNMDDFGSGSISYGVLFNNSSEILFEILHDDDNQSFVTSTTALTTGGTTWHHISVTYDGAFKKVYVDGVEEGSATETRSIQTPVLAEPLVFGRRQDQGIDRFNYFDGSLDEVRVSRVARSSEWIATEYSNQNSPGVGGFLQSIGAIENNCSIATGSVLADETEVASGENTQISILGQDAGATLQWQSSLDGCSWGDILGATSSTLDAGPLTQTTFFRVEITNGCVAGSERVLVNVVPAFLNGFSGRKAITLNGAQIYGTHTDFPVLISLPSDTDLLAGVNNANGYDIAFADSDGTTVLDHELQSYDNGSGALVAWVKTDLVDQTDKEIYLYYGNSAVTTDQSDVATWSNNYESVHHMEDATDQSDATTNGFTLTNDGTTQIAGVIGNGRDLDGTNDHLLYTNDIDMLRNVSAATLSAWVYFEDLADYQIIMAASIGGTGSVDASRASIEFNNSNSDRIRIGGRPGDGDGFEGYQQDNVSVSASVWYYVTGVIDYTGGGDMKIYIDGTEVAGSLLSPPIDGWSVTSTSNTASRNGGIGAEDHGLDKFFDGRVDEARFSSVVRSADWIRTEYLNQNDPAGFLTLGTPENCLIDAGTITAQDASIASGDSTILSIFGYEVGATIQWKSSTDSITFTDIAGATNSTLNTGALTQTTYFRANVTEGCTSNIDVGVDIVGAFLSDFAFRKKLTLDGTKIAGAHTDFPVLIKIDNDPDLLAGIQNPSGYDIQFTDGDASTLLNFEIEDYDAATGSLTAWVTMDLQDATSKEIYLYYGKDEISDPSTAATWDTNYAAVWHFNDAGDDASSNNNNASNNGTTATDGIISGGLAFAGGEYLEVPLDPSLSFTTGYSIQVWVKPDQLPTNDPGIFMHKQITPNVGGLTLEMLNSNDSWVNYAYDASWQNVNSGANSVDLDWQYITVTYDGSNINMYKNGELINSTPFTGPVNVPGSITTYIGRNDDGTTPEDFVGSMDELKLSTIARSSNWIRTEYFNQSDPASFTTVGEEELCPIQLGTVNALDDALAVGGTTTLNLSDYENGVAIQWQQSTDNVSWSDIGGATTDSYTTAALSQTTFYRVQQTATCTVATE
ncbi:MAG: DUF2341 domain-containing protein, partial [Bacteroidota bacterium]